jgi:inorganic pyrophosphatase/exopolyphosphatase
MKDKEMIDGINFITDESGNNKAIILDLIRFKKDGVKDKAVFEALENLQQLIDNALSEKKQGNTWDQAKEKLKNFNP